MWLGITTGFNYVNLILSAIAHAGSSAPRNLQNNIPTAHRERQRLGRESNEMKKSNIGQRWYRAGAAMLLATSLFWLVFVIRLALGSQGPAEAVLTGFVVTAFLATPFGLGRRWLVFGSTVQADQARNSTDVLEAQLSDVSIPEWRSWVPIPYWRIRSLPQLGQVLGIFRW